MEIAFETRKLRSICESEAIALREMGPNISETLKHRLADIRAASSIADLVVGNARFWGDGEAQRCVIDLIDGCHITCKANHPDNPLTDSETLDWERISRLKIVEIGRGNAQ